MHLRPRSCVVYPQRRVALVEAQVDGDVAGRRIYIFIILAAVVAVETMNVPFRRRERVRVVRIGPGQLTIKRGADEAQARIRGQEQRAREAVPLGTGADRDRRTKLRRPRRLLRPRADDGVARGRSDGGEARSCGHGLRRQRVAPLPGHAAPAIKCAFEFCPLRI